MESMGVQVGRVRSPEGIVSLGHIPVGSQLVRVGDLESRTSRCPDDDDDDYDDGDELR